MPPSPAPVAFTAAVRAQVLTRDLNRCARCGRYLPEGAHLHHRKLRSQGGRGVVANGVTLCPLDHHWVHTHVAAAQHIGFIVPSWADPEACPIITWRGAVLLTVDGEAVTHSPEPTRPTEW